MGSPGPEECSPNAAVRQATRRKQSSELPQVSVRTFSQQTPTQSPVPRLLVLGWGPGNEGSVGWTAASSVLTAAGGSSRLPLADLGSCQPPNPGH